MVIQTDGFILEERIEACDHSFVAGTKTGRQWVRENVKVQATTDDPTKVKQRFWSNWLEWEEKGALLAADVPWPVEAQFLRECVLLEPEENKWKGPYPLIDIASILLAKGMDPLAEYPRLEGETPKHDPCCDARQSARLLIEALNR